MDNDQVQLGTAYSPVQSHPPFERVRKPHRFFRIGRIFATLWVEPKSEYKPLESSSESHSAKPNVFSKIRRFIVVHEGHHAALCVPVNTYGGQGSLKPDIRLKDHAQVYQYHKAQPKIESSMRKPLGIVLEGGSDRHRLHPASLANFGKMYTIEHGIPVMNIGYVHKSHADRLSSKYDLIEGQSLSKSGDGLDKMTSATGPPRKRSLEAEDLPWRRVSVFEMESSRESKRVMKQQYEGEASYNTVTIKEEPLTHTMDEPLKQSMEEPQIQPIEEQKSITWPEEPEYLGSTNQSVEMSEGSTKKKGTEQLSIREKTIRTVQRAVDVTMDNHSNENLQSDISEIPGSCLDQRRESITDLDEAIQKAQQAVDATQEDHLEHTEQLSNLEFLLDAKQTITGMGAAGYFNTGRGVMMLLLDRRGEDIQITGEVAKAAAANKGSKGIRYPRQVSAFAVTSQTASTTNPQEKTLPLLDLWAVPFRRDPDFINRGTLLDQMRKKCSVPASRIALVGLGGVGKTQLAIEYCYRAAEQSPDTWVFWVHASSAAHLEQGFRDIADQVKLEGRKDPQANLFKLVHDWLRNETHGRWLLVLDNADDAAVLSPSSKNGQHYLSRYLPPSRHGSVIVTSRTRYAASRLVEESDILCVEPMNNIDAEALLQKKLGDKVDKVGVDQLAAALEYIPLALVQAAAYIQMRAPRCSVRTYLKEFRTNDRRKASLLSLEAGHLRRDVEAKNSIITTWQISFDYIQSRKRSAANLLSFISFFDPHGIPIALLRDWGVTQTAHRNTNADNGNESNTDEEDSTRDANSNNGIEDNILMLQDYSFVYSIDEDTLEMYSLVQLATQRWLKSKDETEEWKQQFISALCHAFPKAQYENWGTCQRLFPHVQAALVKPPYEEESLKEWALLLYNAAWYAWQSGSIAKAGEMVERSLEARIKLFRPDSEETLNSMEMMGLVRNSEGRWKDAEELFIRVIEARKTKLGDDHPDTLGSIANLASTCRNQGRWREAEDLGVQVMEARKMKLGADHPDTLSSIANLASIYGKQWRLGEAEQLHIQVVETREMKLGVDHPDTLSSMADLAKIYRKQGRREKAELLNIQVMETRKTKLGADHPDTLSSMASLAGIYKNQGRWKEAEQLHMQVIETRKMKLGPDHPATLSSMAKLAKIYRKQGRRETAEQLHIQLVETRKIKLGADHPDTLSSMASLAGIYKNQGRWKEAEQLHMQVIETRKLKFGTDHPATVSSMGKLAWIYGKQGRWAEAEQLYVRVMKIHKVKLGADHPATLTSMANLASIYGSQERWQEAEQLYVQVTETRKAQLGAGHPDTLSSMASLASIYGSQERWKEAERLSVQVIEARKVQLGAGHHDTLGSMTNLASIYGSQGRWKEAEHLRMQVLEARKMRAEYHD